MSSAQKHYWRNVVIINTNPSKENKKKMPSSLESIFLTVKSKVDIVGVVTHRVLLDTVDGGHILGRQLEIIHLNIG